MYFLAKILITALIVAALPMVGGMVTTTLLTPIVIPVVYFIYEGRHFDWNKIGRFP